MKTIKLLVAFLGLSLLMVTCGSATDHGDSSQFGNGLYEGRPGHGHDDGGLNHIDHDWNNHPHDWLSPGGYYYTYPTAYYGWYSAPYYTYTYYPPYYYTTPVSTPVAYYDWDLDPWWGTSVYGFGTTYYYSGSHWGYGSGIGLV